MHAFGVCVCAPGAGCLGIMKAHRISERTFLGKSLFSLSLRAAATACESDEQRETLMAAGREWPMAHTHARLLAPARGPWIDSVSGRVGRGMGSVGAGFD
jgi:hypothetical protein